MRRWINSTIQQHDWGSWSSVVTDRKYRGTMIANELRSTHKGDKGVLDMLRSESSLNATKHASVGSRGDGASDRSDSGISFRKVS